MKSITVFGNICSSICVFDNTFIQYIYIYTYIVYICLPYQKSNQNTRPLCIIFLGCAAFYSKGQHLRPRVTPGTYTVFDILLTQKHVQTLGMWGSVGESLFDRRKLKP